MPWKQQEAPHPAKDLLFSSWVDTKKHGEKFRVRKKQQNYMATLFNLYKFRIKIKTKNTIKSISLVK